MPAEFGTQTSKTSRSMTPERVRRLLVRLGPGFIKVGQYLALRPDLIGQEYCLEFLKLADRVPSFPFEEARRTIAEDLGRPPEAFFAWINPRPLAAGSLAQVHAARTRQGAEVAIKIQRPGIRQAVKRDLGRARLIGRILDMTQTTRLISPADLIGEVGRWMHDELDFDHELHNLTSLYNLSKENDRVRIPRPFPALCSARVLTAEFLSGVPLTEVLALLHSGQPDRLRPLQIDPEEVAENLLYTVLDQIFRLEFFHADIHPGNLLVMSGNRIGFIDFGLSETLDPQFRQGMLRYLAAVSAGDLDRMFDGLTELLIASERSDLNRLRADFYEESGRWQYERRQQAAGNDSPTSRYLIAVLRAARRNQFRVPPRILSLYRTLLTAETLASQLGARANLATAGKPLFDQMQVRAVLQALSLDHLQPTILDGLNLISDGPRSVHRLLTDLVNGQLVLRVRTVESEEDRRQTNARARLVSISTISVGLAFLIDATKSDILFGFFPLSWVFWALLMAAWGWVVLRWRDLR